MSENGRTPLLQREENSFENHLYEGDGNSRAMYKDTSHSTLSRSFSAESGQYGGGAAISYHNICYSITTKEKGVKTEKEIIKNLRWDLSHNFHLIRRPAKLSPSQSGMPVVRCTINFQLICNFGLAI